jgi:uncharacterized repeat protein (TIGR02543 family)
MAIDASSHAVLFGGLGAGLLNDTWVWNGRVWALQTPTTSPTGRYFAAMASDSSGNIVLFGGEDFSGPRNDTWVWNGSNWSQKNPGTVPPARYLATMSTDPAGHVVMFGGEGDSGLLDDTWVWNGSDWLPQSVANPPAARALGAMGLDANGNTVLFGGTNEDGSQVFADTWIWDGSNWSPQSVPNPPPARSGAAMAFDSVQKQLELFGGSSQSGTLLSDYWTWDGSNWTSGGAPAPTAREFAAMAYDAVNKQTVLFGGDGQTNILGDTWIHGVPVAPVVATNPTNVTLTIGATATFTAAATGFPTPTVQWQVSTNGGAFSNVPSATTTTLSFVPTIDQSGNQYQAVFTNVADSATTTAATLTVNPQMVAVTVGTSPGGLNFTVDGTPYSGSNNFSWVLNSQHTIATSSPQGSNGTQYTFSNWSDGGAQSHQVTASAAATYTASFNTAYQLTTSANPSADGSVSPASGTYYASGAVVNLTATPSSANYAFTSWTGNVANSNSASTTVTMSAPQSVTANFQQNVEKITVGTNVTGLTFTVDGVNYTAPAMLNWGAGSSHTISTASPQTAPGTQYSFTGWSDGGAISHSVTAPSSAATYTASFSTAYQLTTSASPSAGGSVSPASGTFYGSGAVVNISATPSSANYAFTGWTGNVANPASASTTVTMSGPESVTANFQHVTLTPTVSWSPAPLPIDSKLTSAQLDATASVAGKFVYTPALGTTISSSTETLKVVFTPTDTTDYSSVTKTVSLPVDVIAVSPTSIDFGTVYLDSITYHSVTVTNKGSAAISIYNPVISILTVGDSREFVADNLCPKSLAAHASCTLKIAFVAGTWYHQQSATLHVMDSSPGSPQSVGLTALTIDPEAEFSSASLSFGTQKLGTSSATKTVTLSNPGATALTIKTLALSGADPGDFKTTHQCGNSLAPGASCTISFTFKPTAKGARSAKFVLTDNAETSSLSLSLSGTGD